MFKKQEEIDSVQERLDTIIELVKDLPKADFDKLIDAMKLIYQGYEKVRKIEQKQSKADDIDLSELME